MNYCADGGWLRASPPWRAAGQFLEGGFARARRHQWRICSRYPMRSLQSDMRDKGPVSAKSGPCGLQSDTASVTRTTQQREWDATSGICVEGPIPAYMSFWSQTHKSASEDFDPLSWLAENTGTPQCLYPRRYQYASLPPLIATSNAPCSSRAPFLFPCSL